MLDRLEAGVQRERVFVDEASHELRTPLAILAAELELADRPERSPEDLRAAVGSAREEIDRLSQLAEDLLVIARFDQGKLPIARQPVELRALLERVRDRFARRAKSDQREIAVDAAAGPLVDLDPFRIEQALGNLVDNALVHGGGDVSLSATQEDGFVVLEVSDQGSGFDAGFEGEAFERFARGDGGRRGGGAGLGLAIVRAIAVSHGGGVSVVSAPGNSTTTVQVRLPIGYSDSSGSAGRRSAVDVLAHPVGALLELQRLLAGLRQGRLVQLHELDQREPLPLVLLRSAPADSHPSHPGRVVLELVGPRLGAFELLGDQDVPRSTPRERRCPDPFCRPSIGRSS